MANEEEVTRAKRDDRSPETKRPIANRLEPGTEDLDRSIALPLKNQDETARPETSSVRDLSLESFERALKELDLIDEEGLRAFRDRLPADSETPKELARELVRAKVISGYQAAAILQGKLKGLVLGNYVVIDKLGAGGGGMVFKARHRKLGRIVALKVLPPSVTADPKIVLRFQREVKVAAQFAHPNIVVAHDADAFQGLHFLVMELVEGNDLATLVKTEGPLPTERAIGLMIQAARGLQVAHTGGIVHRDIKPSNLMLDRAGTVKVLDMGLARVTDIGEDSGARRLEEGLTQVNSIMGTVDYMSPEQAFNSTTADARSDVYSLGCTFYYLLTGNPPFGGGTLVQRLLAHRDRPIPTLPTGGPALSAHLQKMMAKNPNDRFQSMEEVIAGFETLLAELSKGTGVASLEAKSVGSERRSSSTKRIGPGLLAAAVVVIIAGWGFWAFSRNHRDPSLLEVVAKPVLKDRPKAAEVSRPLPVPKVDPKPKIEENSKSKPKTVAKPETIGVTAELRGHDRGRAECAAIAPNGLRAASGGMDGTVRVWNLGKREEAFKIVHGGPVHAVAFSADGRWIVSAGEDGRIKIWGSANGDKVRDFSSGEGRLQALACGRLGTASIGLAAGMDKSVRLWDLTTAQALGGFEQDAAVNAATFLPDRFHAALTAGNDRTIRFWDLEDLSKPRRLEVGFRVLCLAVAPDGRRALAGGRDGALVLRDLGGQGALRLEGHRNFVMCVGFLSEDLAVSGDLSGALILWDLKSGLKLWQTPTEGPGRRGLAVFRDGRHILTADDDGVVRLWNLVNPATAPNQTKR